MNAVPRALSPPAPFLLLLGPVGSRLASPRRAPLVTPWPSVRLLSSFLPFSTFSPLFPSRSSKSGKYYGRAFLLSFLLCERVLRRRRGSIATSLSLVRTARFRVASLSPGPLLSSLSCSHSYSCVGNSLPLGRWRTLLHFLRAFSPPRAAATATANHLLLFSLSLLVPRSDPTHLCVFRFRVFRGCYSKIHLFIYERRTSHYRSELRYFRNFVRPTAARTSIVRYKHGICKNYIKAAKPA